MITRFVRLAFAHLREWHKQNLKYGFSLNVMFPPTEPERTVVYLAYLDYVMWHQIEEFPDQIVSCMKSNAKRNESMDEFDVWWINKGIPNQTGTMNSETMASLLDRIINHEIKRLHLQDARDKRLNDIRRQLRQLINCAERLEQECRSGSRKCVPLSRFKIGYPQ